MFTHPTKPINILKALPIGEKAAHVFVNVSYLILVLVPVGTSITKLYANNKSQQCNVDACYVFNSIQTYNALFREQYSKRKVFVVKIVIHFF